MLVTKFKHETIPEIANGLREPLSNKTGPVSAQVQLGNSTIVRRHHDQLLARQSPSTEQVLPPQRQSEVQCEDATHGSPQQGRPTSEAPVEETELVNYPIRSRGAPERFE